MAQYYPPTQPPAHFRNPLPDQTPPQQSQPKRPWYKLKRTWLIVGGLGLCVLIGGLAAGTEQPEAEPVAATTTEDTTPEVKTPTPTDAEPALDTDLEADIALETEDQEASDVPFEAAAEAPTANVSPTEEENPVSVAADNAVTAAESYLSYSGFSRSGLIDQLIFEGFTEKEATAAVDSLTVDWGAQAGRSAESYLSTMAFSESGLIEQLEFEGFSTADATAAVGQMTVDWNEQAAQKAENYVSMSGFSRSGLIDQLKFEGFSDSQAAYGADSVGL
ncbi:Ltp family lipoprotein [Auritidibacter sp. NML100628]|uniref:Ltp family lipoprotein n=1 Tax=Auritidibacter sp. NML100628 TaxID=2170742 RepID=UPI000D72B8F1|nr:Ltp family lipoprotein [Auritidibacter sp. NML100628]PXA77986.1 hypothetical protein DCC24_03000 [Auritidibacter sp. NML100628]